MTKTGIMAVLAVAVAACSTASPATSESISVPELATTSGPEQEPAPTLPSTTLPPPTAPATTAPEMTTAPVMEPRMMAVGDLGSPVLAHGSADQELRVMDRKGQRALRAGPVEAVRRDGGGGLVVQTAEGEIEWLPHLTSDRSVTLTGAKENVLRGILPDGRALYSRRPPTDGTSDRSVEQFLAVELVESAEPEAVASAPALERWTVGPTFAADGQAVHAACHLHCSLWPGLAEASQGADPLYHGGGNVAPGAAIDGLSATSDGRVLGFVEYDPVTDDPIVGLVLLDGATFEVLSRHSLPVDGDRVLDRTTVSLSADGQRILVGVGGPSGPPNSLLISDALTDSTLVSILDIDAHLRWLDPIAASGQGGLTTEQERRVADRLAAFARSPGASTFAALPLGDEVGLGLGPHLVRPEISPHELADRGAWKLPGPFRAHTGPFSAIELLSQAKETQITAGPHAHCAAPPVPAPEEVADLSRVSLQPVDPTSCLQWWTVDLFLTEAGDIAAITLDLWEP